MENVDDGVMFSTVAGISRTWQSAKSSLKNCFTVFMNVTFTVSTEVPEPGSACAKT